MSEGTKFLCLGSCNFGGSEMRLWPIPRALMTLTTSFLSTLFEQIGIIDEILREFLPKSECSNVQIVEKIDPNLDDIDLSDCNQECKDPIHLEAICGADNRFFEIGFYIVSIDNFWPVQLLLYQC